MATKKTTTKPKAAVVEFTGKNKSAVAKLAGGLYLEHEDGRIQVDLQWVEPGDFVIKGSDGKVRVHNDA